MRSIASEVAGMADDRKLRDELTALERDHAVLKQEMQTMQAKYLTELERNGRKFDAALADLKAAMDRRDTEAAKRDKDNQRWLMVTMIALMSAGFGFIAFMIRTGGTVPGP